MKTIIDLNTQPKMPIVGCSEALDRTRELPGILVRRCFGRSMRIATFCLLAYWFAIFVGTHLPASNVPKIQINDKLLHFGAFAGLAFLLAWAVPTQNGRTKIRLAIVLAVICAYACIDELSQKLVPGRQSSMWDLGADISGAVVGMMAYLVCRFTLIRFELGRRLIRVLSR